MRAHQGAVMDWKIEIPRKMTDQERFERMGCLIMTEEGRYQYGFERGW